MFCAICQINVRFKQRHLSKIYPFQASILMYNKDFMNKFLKYSLILALVSVLPTTSVLAQIAPTAVKNTEKVAISADKGAVVDTSDQSLQARKDIAEKDFKSVALQLSVFVTRTQAALDRISTKSIDTGATQDELSLANDSLIEAKANLSVFSKVVVPADSGEKTDKASLELKASAKKTEDSLKEAKTHIINAISILKDALNITTKSS